MYRCPAETEVKRIAVISDTHGLLRPEVKEVLSTCDVILHGGDINRQEVLDELGVFARLYAVRGNNDREWAVKLPQELRIRLFGLNFYMVHNKKQIPQDINGTDIIIYGHSHKYEENYQDGRLWLNPGSCGPRRFKLPVTMAVISTGPENGRFKVEKLEFVLPAAKEKLPATGKKYK